MQAAEVAAVAERLYAEDYDEHEGIAEESVAEVMRWLELEIKLAAGAASLLPLPAAPCAAVGAGSWESCGPSMSKPASTVMASVDGRAGAPPPPAVPWPWPWPFPDPAARNDDEEQDDDGAADEWVLQLLTDGPAVEGQCGSQ